MTKSSGSKPVWRLVGKYTERYIMHLSESIVVEVFFHNPMVRGTPKGWKIRIGQKVFGDIYDLDSEAKIEAVKIALSEAEEAHTKISNLYSAMQEKGIIK